MIKFASPVTPSQRAASSLLVSGMALTGLTPWQLGARAANDPKGTAQAGPYTVRVAGVRPGGNSFSSFSSFGGGGSFGPGGFRNLDHVPVEGLLPTEKWRPGQRIRDRQRIAIPPDMAPGLYTVFAGGDRAGSAARLPVTPRALTDGQDRLRLGTFTVR